jgi:hypothetical protein
MAFINFVTNARFVLIVVQGEPWLRKRYGGEVQRKTNLCMSDADLLWRNMKVVAFV